MDPRRMSSGTRRFDQPARILQRLELMAAAYGVAAAALFAVLRSILEASILTLATAASIVAFRGLQRLVAAMGAREDGKIDRRSRVLVTLRFALLTLVPVGSLWLNPRLVLALLVGFSALPLALMTEGILLLLILSREPKDGS